jgi:glycosyltransferase involved in cell wall biosynthesis
MAPRADRVSVVIPTRNRRALLERSLGTALGQHDVEVEAVVVDDASDDGTPAYLEALADPRVVVVRHGAPEGVARARNAGLAAARAPWVAFLDDDDVWAPSKLSDQLGALGGSAARWACAGTIVLDAGLVPTAAQRLRDPDATLPRLLSYNVVPGGASGVLAATDLVRQVGGFDPTLRVFADWDLWLRLAQDSPPAYVDRPLVGYVLHGANMTSGGEHALAELDRFAEKTAAVRAEHGATIERDRWEAWLADMRRRGGARLGPSLTYARLAGRTRRPYYAMRAVTVALLPGWVGRQDRKRRESLDPGWREEADAWLEPLRRTAAARSG